MASDSRNHRDDPEEDFFFFPEDYDDPQPEQKSGRRKHSSILRLLLIIIPLAILLIAAVILVKMLIWNKGQASVYDYDSADTGSYDVEVQDMVISLSDSRRALQADDGVTTILFLGNDPLSDDLTATGIPAVVDASRDGLEIYAAPFPGSGIACTNAIYDTSDADDVFNFYYVCSAIGLGNFDAMNTVASMKDDTRYTDSAEILTSLDYSLVDMIVIFYDAVDYLNGSPVMNENNPDDIQTYTGSLRSGLDLLNKKHPNIRIVFMSPTYAEYSDGSSESSGDTTDLGNGALPTYWTKAIDVTSAEGVSFIDNYYGSVNEDNYREFLSDNIHLNEAGRAKVADHFLVKIIDGSPEEYHP